MGERRVLLFDLGGVVVHSAGLDALARLLPDLGPEELTSRWQRSSAVWQFETGRISAADFASSFVAEWALPLLPAEFLQSFASWIQGFYPGAKALIERQRARHVVACLSNTNAVHWERLVEVRASFDVCIASHLIGHMKPEIAAYQHALEALGVSADEVHFFDDLHANVTAARSLGIKAFQVRGVAELAATLDSVGLSGANGV